MGRKPKSFVGQLSVFSSRLSVVAMLPGDSCSLEDIESRLLFYYGVAGRRSDTKSGTEGGQRPNDLSLPSFSQGSFICAQVSCLRVGGMISPFHSGTGSRASGSAHVTTILRYDSQETHNESARRAALRWVVGSVDGFTSSKWSRLTRQGSPDGFAIDTRPSSRYLIRCI